MDGTSLTLFVMSYNTVLTPYPLSHRRQFIYFNSLKLAKLFINKYDYSLHLLLRLLLFQSFILKT